MVAAIDPKALQGFLDETSDSLQDIESAFIRLEEDPSNQEIINEIFRPVHSMKGNSGFFGLTNINHFAHRLRGVLHTVVTLTEFFDLPPAAEAAGVPQVLVIWNREWLAFLADRMFSHQKIVVRSLPERYKQFREVPGINGYTILGKEEIVLIVDPADVAARATAAEAA